MIFPRDWDLQNISYPKSCRECRYAVRCKIALVEKCLPVSNMAAAKVQGEFAQRSPNKLYYLVLWQWFHLLMLIKHAAYPTSFRPKGREKCYSHLMYQDTTMLQKQKTLQANQTMIVHANCLDVLQEMGSDEIDLIVTSPPYANQRNSTYGGVRPDQYVDWFLPISEELFRVLRPSGSFILNIKEKVVGGERHTYVMELILEMRKQGWLWTEEYIWHKKNSFPGKWPNRFRDSWERCLHFNKTKKFSMYQDEVRIPMGEWKKNRLKNLSKKDRTRDESRVGSGFGKKIDNWSDREFAYPTNVLHLATECYNRKHSAAFPESLPEWFIKLFTKKGDVVLDPFLGSGTTIQVAKKMGRVGIGMEIVHEYCKVSAERIGLSESCLRSHRIYK